MLISPAKNRTFLLVPCTVFMSISSLLFERTNV
jgi:hypothetical protein